MEQATIEFLFLYFQFVFEYPHTYISLGLHVGLLYISCPHHLLEYISHDIGKDRQICQLFFLLLYHLYPIMFVELFVVSHSASLAMSSHLRDYPSIVNQMDGKP